MFTISGSGFGLYGYLPALILNLNEKVILPKKYRAIIKARADISNLIPTIIWAENFDDALLKADSLVLALPPHIQQQFFWDQH